MYKIIPTEYDRIDDIYAIEVECFADPWSVSALMYEVCEENSVCLMAVNENDDVVGHVSMRHIINEGHINNIAVTAVRRKNGVGSLLLEALLQEAVKREMIGLTLEVRASNEPAIKLYEKFGFIPEGCRKNYYFNPTEDAIIMWKRI